MMLSAGYAPTSWLKQRLMPEASQEETEWDDKIVSIGLAVAARFEGWCNRSFDREVGAVDTFNACARTWTLRRYPVESISTIELVDPDGDSSELDLGDFRLMEKAGVVNLSHDAGHTMQRVRITYTGGFWLDPGDGTAQPAGTTAMPAELLDAWVAQVQHACAARGIFSDVAMGPPAVGSGLGLLDEVKETLLPLRRFAGP